MRKGQPYQWTMDGGAGDSGSLGRAMAMAEWNRIRIGIMKAEQPDVDASGFIIFKSDVEVTEHHAIYADRHDYDKSPLSSSMSFSDWKEFQEFKAWQDSKLRSENSGATGGPNLGSILSATNGAKPLKELTAIFRAHLKHRFAQTKPGLKSKENISESRYTQYGFATSIILIKQWGWNPSSHWANFIWVKNSWRRFSKTTGRSVKTR